MYELISDGMYLISFFIFIASILKVWPLISPSLKDPWKNVPTKVIISEFLALVIYVFAVLASFFLLGSLLSKFFSIIVPEEMHTFTSGLSFLISASILYPQYSKFLNFIISYLEKHNLFENDSNGLQGYFESRFKRSNAIYTDLTRQEVSDTFIDYGQKYHYYHKKSDKIILKKNFAVKLNTKSIESKRFVKLDFTKTKGKFYSAFWFSFGLLCFILSVAGAIGLLIELGLIVIILELIISKLLIIAGKRVDYSKEADKIFLEIASAISEKEARMNGIP